MKRKIIFILALFLISPILYFSQFMGNLENNANDLDFYNEIEIKSANEVWLPEISRVVGDSPLDLFVGDANNDGINEILTADTYDGAVSILVYDSIISNDWYHIFQCIGNSTTCVAVGDADNDGYNDIVAAGYNVDTFYSSVSILLWNTGTSEWDAPIVKPVGVAPFDVCIGDVDNDGDNDLVTSNMGANNISILLWNGIDWDPQITKEVGSTPRTVAVGDIDNDGDNDIATANDVEKTISIILWNETIANWDPQIKKTVGSQPKSVCIGDANNDGFNDTLVTNDLDDNISIFLWNETDNNWNSEFTLEVGYGPWDVFIGDANNDGLNDILTSNTVGNTVSILLWNDTLSNWNEKISKNTGSAPIGICAIDVDGDNDNDIVTANQDQTVSILLWGEIELSELSMVITDQSFTEDNFNITCFIHDENGLGISSATIQAIWNDQTVPSNNIENLGSGSYLLSLIPVTVAPNEAPILLNITISANDYEDANYEFYLAVDPDLLDKSGNGVGPPIIFGYSIILIICLISFVSVIIIKRR